MLPNYNEDNNFLQGPTFTNTQIYKRKEALLNEIEQIFTNIELKVWPEILKLQRTILEENNVNSNSKEYLEKFDQLLHDQNLIFGKKIKELELLQELIETANQDKLEFEKKNSENLIAEYFHRYLILACQSEVNYVSLIVLDTIIKSYPTFFPYFLSDQDVHKNLFWIFLNKMPDKIFKDKNTLADQWSDVLIKIIEI